MSVKKWGNTHAELKTRVQNLRLNSCFHRNFENKFLVEMGKAAEAGQPFLLVHYSAKFVLFESCRLSTKSLVLRQRLIYFS